jgi:hypothetical protein
MHDPAFSGTRRLRMKNVILFVCLIWAMGCAVGDDWTPEPIDVESINLPDGWGITVLGLIMPPGYCEGSDGIPYYCGDTGGGPGGGTGGGEGGGGGYGSAPCGSWSNYGCTAWVCETANGGSDPVDWFDTGWKKRTCTYRRVCPDGGTEEQTQQERVYDPSTCNFGP